MARKLRVHPTLNKGYGWRRPSLPRRHPVLSPLFEGDLPSSVDLRPKCPAVYDQADLGSCTANALAGLAEFLMIKEGHAAYVPSRLFIYYNERAMEGDVGDDAGASIADGASVISKLGCPNETIWWYNTAKFRVKPNKKVYTDGLKHLVGGVSSVNQNLNDMRKVLALGTPIVGGFTVYDSFESDAVANNGVVPMPDTSKENVLGGHAVLLVGYDDAKQWFVVRNSWGSSWGDQGYCYMPYQYWTDSTLSDDFWTGLSVS